MTDQSVLKSTKTKKDKEKDRHFLSSHSCDGHILFKKKSKKGITANMYNKGADVREISRALSCATVLSSDTRTSRT